MKPSLAERDLSDGGWFRSSKPLPGGLPRLLLELQKFLPLKAARSRGRGRLRPLLKPG